ncbi:MAG: hypothetical protein QNJ64_10865 [Crocosphaera sp.]|nr:hypothetical protein [Crocosphaera sp.]
MKVTVIVFNLVATLLVLTGSGILLDKLERASLSNPFVVKTANLTVKN